MFSDENKDFCRENSFQKYKANLILGKIYRYIYKINLIFLAFVEPLHIHWCKAHRIWFQPKDVRKAT